MASVHVNSLAEICRLCGQPDTTEGKHQRKLTPKSRFGKEIKQGLDIDLQLDIPGVHPEVICFLCESKIVRWKKKHAKSGKKPSMTSIVPTMFHPHEDGNCAVCKEAAERHPHQTPTEAPVHEGTALQVQAEIVAKANGFITWKGEYNQFVFVTLNQNLCASRAVMIYPDASWCIKVLDRDVSPPDIPRSMDVETLEELFQWACMPFCSGSSDFPDLVESGVPLRNRSGDKTLGFIDTKFPSDETKTIRSASCEGITQRKSDRCAPCAQFRNDLFARRAAKEKTATGSTTSHARNDQMDRMTLERKTSNLKRENLSLKASLKRLQERITQMMESEAVDVDAVHSNELVDIFEENSSAMESLLPQDSPQRLLWEEQRKYLGLKDARQMRWHPTIIKWCIALHEKSPAAYKALRSSSFIKLPHQNTLFKHTHFTDARSGINPDILRSISQEADLDHNPEFYKNVSLIFDEMKIKNGLVYSQRSGKICGFTEMGDLNDEILRFERDVNKDDDPVMATYVMVFMIRGLFSPLKKSVAWYPCTGFTSSQIFHCMWEVVERVEYAGFHVRAFVSCMENQTLVCQRTALQILWIHPGMYISSAMCHISSRRQETVGRTLAGTANPGI